MNDYVMLLEANHFIRVLETGEWIEITLHNLFNPAKPVEYFDYPSVPLDFKHQPSMRVSLNPQYLYMIRSMIPASMWDATTVSKP